MDIKITDSALRQFLDTKLSPSELGLKVSLCGPTFDRIHSLDHDSLYEIEVITNRVDTASAQGIARESAAILKQMGIDAKLKNDPYQEKIELYKNLSRPFTFNIKEKDLVNQFIAVSLENVNITNSSEATQSFLTACGERPINNVVDITNEITLLYGMPCHIFDLDKLAIQELIIRQSREGETVKTLDDQTNQLRGGDIVIEDGAGRLVDLCGIMGGSVAEVDNHTKNILLIVPVYQAQKIRHSSLYLQKRTLASQIYEKQPDPELCLPVMMKAISLFKDRSGARVSSSVYVYNTQPYAPQVITLDIDWLNSFVGISIPTVNIISILNNLGFTTNLSDSKIECKVPSWRLYDIKIKEDLAEEVARVYGYYLIPAQLPCVHLSPEAKDPVLSLESKLKTILSNQGFNEIYNSSLISPSLIQNLGLKTEDHLQLKNALSEEYQYLRTSLVPSILQNLKDNQGKTDEPVLIYELSNVYQKTEEKLPDEHSKLVVACEHDFRHTKGLTELLLEKTNAVGFSFTKSTGLPEYYIPGQSADIHVGTKTIGHIGYIKKAILHQIGISSDPVIVEIDVPQLASVISDKYTYRPISEFPEVTESITVKTNTPVGETMKKIASIDTLIRKITFTDLYQDRQTYKVSFGSMDKNLTQNEVNEIKAKIQSLFN